MNGIYESFIPEYMWHELKYSVRTALQPKGPMAAFNHTDHLTLSVPNPRTCFFQDHIVQQLGYRIGTDLFIMDPQDFLFVALNSFNGEGIQKLKCFAKAITKLCVCLCVFSSHFVTFTVIH